jgi:hypothetical protein
VLSYEQVKEIAMKYTFKQFHAEYLDDQACLGKIMQEKFGGTEITCPSCKMVSKFHPMSKHHEQAPGLCL